MEKKLAESRLPAPAQLLLVPMSEEEVAEMIEKHIEFVDETGRPVHLPMAFVRHYMKRDDGALPIATTVSQLPIVLHSGELLKGPGLHRPSGVVFRLPKELMDWLPEKKEECDGPAVIKAMQFLTEEWLCDVAADYEGKCTIIACALTVIERAVLPQRPAFFIVAGRRGGGKTTTIHMVSTAVLGIPACAAAWSKDPEERRKALLAYFIAGLPMLTWDNITKGASISCTHIERALTNEFYTDRVLGASQNMIVLTSTVHLFTGNNISPRGDMNSRSLTVRLAVERPDPENREFKHTDPLDWTEAHRGEILNALYTILLGNPRRQKRENSPLETRFKIWWDIVGSAVEHAAALCAGERCESARAFKFSNLFNDQEADDEESGSLADALKILAERWSEKRRFKAEDLAAEMNAEKCSEDVKAVRQFLYPEPDAASPSHRSVGNRIQKHIGNPVIGDDGRTYILKREKNQHIKIWRYYVDVAEKKPTEALQEDDTLPF